ncbi:dienelactone hydrolase family protein [Alistipes sp.]
MHWLKPWFGALFIGVLLAGCGGSERKYAALSRKLLPYTIPPDTYREDYGTYRSPLLFYNGDSVRTPADWMRRRAEIRSRWDSLLGAWPPLIADQRFEFVDTLPEADFNRYRVRFRWLPGETTEGYLLIPHGKGRKAAVITLYYEPETAVGLGGKPCRDFALRLAERGFVTLSLGTTQTTRARTYSLYYPSIDSAAMQPLSALAYAAANAWETLARCPEVDSTRIGVMGHSYGGKWAMFASCLWEKFACAVWGDPGVVFDETKGGYVNYWEPWYLGYYPPPWVHTWDDTGAARARGLYPSLRREGYDLHELHALMAPRPFLVSGGYSDGPERWTALNHTTAVNRLLGFEGRVAMTNRPSHDPDSLSNALAYEFFELWLRPDLKK